MVASDTLKLFADSTGGKVFIAILKFAGVLVGVVGAMVLGLIGYFEVANPEQKMTESVKQAAPDPAKVDKMAEDITVIKTTMVQFADDFKKKDTKIDNLERLVYDIKLEQERLRGVTAKLDQYTDLAARLREVELELARLKSGK